MPPLAPVSCPYLKSLILFEYSHDPFLLPIAPQISTTFVPLSLCFNSPCPLYLYLILFSQCQFLLFFSSYHLHFPHFSCSSLVVTECIVTNNFSHWCLRVKNMISARIMMCKELVFHENISLKIIHL